MSHHTPPDERRRAFYTVQQIAERHPAFTQRTIRHWIFFAKERLCWHKGQRQIIPGNGFAAALVRRGRRVYIDEGAMLKWLESFGFQPSGGARRA